MPTVYFLARCIRAALREHIVSLLELGVQRIKGTGAMETHESKLGIAFNERLPFSRPVLSQFIEAISSGE